MHQRLLPFLTAGNDMIDVQCVTYTRCLNIGIFHVTEHNQTSLEFGKQGNTTIIWVTVLQISKEYAEELVN